MVDSTDWKILVLHCVYFVAAAILGSCVHLIGTGTIQTIGTVATVFVCVRLLNSFIL